MKKILFLFSMLFSILSCTTAQTTKRIDLQPIVSPSLAIKYVVIDGAGNSKLLDITSERFYGLPRVTSWYTNLNSVGNLDWRGYFVKENNGTNISCYVDSLGTRHPFLPSQTMSINGHQLTLSNGNTISLPAADVKAIKAGDGVAVDSTGGIYTVSVPTLNAVTVAVFSKASNAALSTETAARIAADDANAANITATNNIVAQKVNTSALATVATSGSYADLSNKPTIPTLPSLATVATSGSYADLSNKPTIPTLPSLATVATSGSYADLSNKPTIPDLTSIDTSFRQTSIGNIKGGTNALKAPTGIANTAIGYNAAQNITTANANTAIGYNALQLLTTNGDNTAVGFQALKSNTGNHNTAVGYNTLSAASNTTGCTAMGWYALGNNSGGMDNTAIGANSLQNNTVGSANVALGNNTLNSHSNGGSNTVVGTAAMQTTTSGSQNTAVGTTAMFLASSANNYTAIGYNAARSITGYNNTVVGQSALSAATIGNYNTVIGSESLMGASGIVMSYNTALGFRAGYNNTGGNFNTYIGDSAAINGTIGSYNIAIGRGALLPSATGNNQLTIGNWITGVNGAITIPNSLSVNSLKVTTGAGVGKVLTADASGNATWQTAATGGGTNIVVSDSLRWSLFGGTTTIGQTTFLNGTSVGTKTIDDGNNTFFVGQNVVGGGSKQLMMGATNSVDNSTAYVTVTPTNLNTSANNTYINTPVGQIRMGDSYGGNVIADLRSNGPGFEYESDYSPNYTNRSLVDKAYVRSQASWSPITAKSASATLLTTEAGTIKVSGTIILTLPAASAATGLKYTFIKTDASGTYLQVNTANNELINADPSRFLTSRWEKFTIQSDGSMWLVVAQ